MRKSTKEKGKSKADKGLSTRKQIDSLPSTHSIYTKKQHALRCPTECQGNDYRYIHKHDIFNKQ